MNLLVFFYDKVPKEVKSIQVEGLNLVECTERDPSRFLGTCLNPPDHEKGGDWSVHSVRIIGIFTLCLGGEIIIVT